MDRAAASLRTVLASVTLAELVAGELSEQVEELTGRPYAWDMR